MENDTDKLIKEQFERLPQPLQRAITLTPWKNLVEEIATSNNLDAESLETETMLVIYGFESQDDFAGNLTSELAIGADKSAALAKEIDVKIFSAVLEQANKFASEKQETLQSTPEITPKTQEIAPMVVVEAAPTSPVGSGGQAKAPINLIPPAPQVQKPIALTPPNLPIERPSINIVEEKRPTAYPDGKDPYREPIH